MKKIFAVFVGMLGLYLGSCGVVLAAAASASTSAANELTAHHWEIGPEIYYFQYKEPDVSVEDKGAMHGVAASYTHHNSNHVMLKVDGRTAWGQVDYSGSGTMDGIEDFVFEGRLSGGYDIRLRENLTFTPFFGIGYRYLNDDSSSRRTSTGAIGYERESNYLYSPVGVEVNTGFGKSWEVGVSVEYDIFWSGKQKSHLEDVSLALNRITNDQNDGYGFRASIKLRKRAPAYDILIEPFIRLWNISDSEISDITYSGTLIGYGYEPQNETLEIGGKISLIF